MNARTAVRKTKTFVRQHKTAIAVVTTIVVMAKLNVVAQKQQLDFINDKGMLEEYLTPDKNI